MNQQQVRSYRDLIVWQRAMQLVRAVYIVTAQFPKSEQYELTSQMRRAAISIPSNIAEGCYRGTKNEFRKFLRIAFASGAELETQITLAKSLLRSDVPYGDVDAMLQEVMKMLNTLIRSLTTTRTFK